MLVRAAPFRSRNGIFRFLARGLTLYPLGRRGENRYTEAEQALRMSVTGRSNSLFSGRIPQRLVDRRRASQATKFVQAGGTGKKTRFGYRRPVTKLFCPARVKSGSFKSKPTSLRKLTRSRSIYGSSSSRDEYDPKSHTLWFAVGEGTNKRWPPEGAFKEMNRGSSAFHEEQLPIGIVPDKGPQNGLVRVHFMNRNSERPIIFPHGGRPDDPLSRRRFRMNLFRAR
ncbi:MAG: hypothetical protein CM1200mP29_04540 [Verrucomicrobiota bacterium]|nr:MAG: hypothetical protein CM1200mP29_04540 [Verrucomicrobiota bacterium]